MERPDGGSSSSVLRAFLVQTLRRRRQAQELAAARPWQCDVQRLAIQQADFHGEWNDPIAPSNRQNQAVVH